MGGKGFEAQKASSQDAEGVGEWGGGSLLRRLEGLGASWAPSVGSGAEPRPKTDFSAFQASQNACRWDVCCKPSVRRHC